MTSADTTIKALLNATTEIAMLIDIHGNILALNKAAAQRLKVDIDEAIGKNAYEMFEPEAASRRRAFAQKIVQAKKSISLEEETRGRHYESSVHPVFDEKGNVIQLAIYAKDVTEYRLAEKRLDVYRKKLRELAAKLSLAEEKERRRIANEVHDHIGQKLAFAKIKLNELKKYDIGPHYSETIKNLYSLIDALIEDVRSLVSEIGNPILHELGLMAALDWLAKIYAQKNNLNISLKTEDFTLQLRDDVKIFLFQSVNELLSNVVKHSNAKNCFVSAKIEGNYIKVEVNDDGLGFEPEKNNADTYQNKKYGLFSIRERLESVGGNLEIYSKPGGGTRISLFAPLGI